MSPAHPSFRKLKEDIWEELLDGKLAVPALIIWGREDPEGSFPAGVAMHEALVAAGSPVSFHAFEKAGHVAYMEYPLQFNKVIADFFRTSSYSITSSNSTSKVSTEPGGMLPVARSP